VRNDPRVIAAYLGVDEDAVEDVADVDAVIDAGIEAEIEADTPTGASS
jgi:hypothetical protein